VTLTR